MTDYAIPILVTPAQTVTVRLGTQAVRITLFQKTTGFYATVTVADVPIVTGRLARAGVPIVSPDYRGFVGTLVFVGPPGDVAYDSGHTLVWSDGE